MDDQKIKRLFKENEIKLKAIKKYDVEMKQVFGIYWSELILKVMQEKAKLLATYYSMNKENLFQKYGIAISNNYQFDNFDYCKELDALDLLPYPKSYFKKYVLPQLLQRVKFI